MFITDLPGEIIAMIMGRLESLQTLQRFLKAIPSMESLLASYPSVINKSVSRFLRKENKLLPYMNAILEAHFSEPMRTNGDLQSFLCHHIGAPSPEAKPAFPHSMGMLDYLIATLRSMKFFYNCASEVTCNAHKNEDITSFTSDSRDMAALLRLQLYTEIFHRPTGQNIVFKWNDQERPKLSRLFWGSFSETEIKECQYISAALIQWLAYKVEGQELGPRTQVSDGKCYRVGLLQLKVLLHGEPHTEREWGYACQLLENGLDTFELDDRNKRKHIMTKTSNLSYSFEYLSPHCRKLLLESLADI